MMPVGETPAGSFEFSTAARIIFGAGRARELPGLVAAIGRRALLVLGASTARHDRLRSAIAANGGSERLEVFSVATEPTVALAEAGADLARAMRADVVVAIGGGSVVDCAKAIAALATNDAPAVNYLEVVGGARPLVHPALPVIAVPTTAGTGAEVTRNAVLSVPEARVKVSLRSVFMLPRLALVDPELAVGLPSAVTTATGLDALTQLIEPYLSCRANVLTDALCLDGISRTVRALPRACHDPGDLLARADLAAAALFSGIALANSGLGVVHGFAGPIGGLFNAPHGAICAALLPHGMRANLAALRARFPGHACLARFTTVARILTGRCDATAEEGVAWVESLTRSLEAPSLSTLGIRSDDAAEIVRLAAQSSSMKANPVVLTPDELGRMLAAALSA
jgi:alcohol dehydrogenase class IV